MTMPGWRDAYGEGAHSAEMMEQARRRAAEREGARETVAAAFGPRELVELGLGAAWDADRLLVEAAVRIAGGTPVTAAELGQIRMQLTVARELVIAAEQAR